MKWNVLVLTNMKCLVKNLLNTRGKVQNFQINQFMVNGIPHYMYYQLDKSISVLRVVGRYFYSNFSITLIL